MHLKRDFLLCLNVNLWSVRHSGIAYSIVQLSTMSVDQVKVKWFHHHSLALLQLSIWLVLFFWLWLYCTMQLYWSLFWLIVYSCVSIGWWTCSIILWLFISLSEKMASHPGSFPEILCIHQDEQDELVTEDNNDSMKKKKKKLVVVCAKRKKVFHYLKKNYCKSFFFPVSCL